jgi:hypothetical protein
MTKRKGIKPNTKGSDSDSDYSPKKKQDRSGRKQDRSGREQDRSGRKQDRTGRVDDRDRSDRVRSFTNVVQYWDYEKPCDYCGCVFLYSEKSDFRKKCCLEGKMVQANCGFKLKPLPAEIVRLLFNEWDDFTRNCAFYNKMLSLLVVGHRNYYNNQGYQNFHGMPSSVRLQGTIYDYFPNNKTLACESEAKLRIKLNHSRRWFELLPL